MSDLADFLLARIGEREALARRALRHAGIADEWADDWTDVRQSPRAVLAECEAHRGIVEEHIAAIGREDVAHGRGLARAARYLALPYADHPDYDEAWRP